jgi:hypothetical protein
MWTGLIISPCCIGEVRSAPIDFGHFRRSRLPVASDYRPRSPASRAYLGHLLLVRKRQGITMAYRRSPESRPYL